MAEIGNTTNILKDIVKEVKNLALGVTEVETFGSTVYEKNQRSTQA